MATMGQPMRITYASRLHSFVFNSLAKSLSDAVESAFDDIDYSLFDITESPLLLRKAVEDDHVAVARMLLDSKHTIVLTGAGISQESGIPTFRDLDNGLWTHNSCADCASLCGFKKDPAKLWNLMRKLNAVEDPQPNEGHLALAQLEELGLVKAIVTQNIDGLHQMAGSKNVVEFHGSTAESICKTCGRKGPPCRQLLEECKVNHEPFPPRCRHCPGVLKPNTTLFDEAVPAKSMKAALAHANNATLILVIGTSARVQPASTLPGIVSRNGGRVVELNLQHTALTGTITDVFVCGRAGVVLNNILNEVRRLKAQ